MKYLILFLKKIFNTNFSKSIRNFLNFRPVHVSLPFHLKKVSISDAFPWRTNDNFETFLRFTDIPKNYLSIKNSFVKIEFYDENGKLIKNKIIKNLKTVNELIINSKTISYKGFGSFYIFHILPDKLNKTFMITNRCYVGFSKKGCNPSFVHGNTYAKYYDGEKKIIGSNLVNKSFFQKEYIIQNHFEKFDFVELFFSNPTDDKIDFSVNEMNFQLNGGASKIVKLSNQDKIKVKSFLFMLRPLIFTFKGKFIDCYHA